jgi:hypothetical protein
MKRGPKPILTQTQRFDLGAECEAAWREFATDAALKSRDHLLHVQQIQEVQQRLVSAKVRWKFEAQRGSEKIDDLLKEARGNRVNTLPIRRPYQHSEVVLRRAVKWCWKIFRKKITPGYARDCWDYFRKCEVRIMAGMKSLNN